MDTYRYDLAVIHQAELRAEAEAARLAATAQRGHGRAVPTGRGRGRPSLAALRRILAGGSGHVAVAE